MSQVEEEKEREVELGKYVYCIIPDPGKEKSFGNIGIEGGSEVYSYSFKDIAAVVSDVPFKKEYKVTEEEASTHNEVNQTVMEEHTVVPMSFGMNFKNEKILKNVLKKIYDDVKQTMREVEGKAPLLRFPTEPKADRSPQSQKREKERKDRKIDCTGRQRGFYLALEAKKGKFPLKMTPQRTSVEASHRSGPSTFSLAP